MDDSYAKQKFYEAVASLIGTGSIQKRLRFALQPLSMLRASSGTVQHLPPDLELRLQKLMEKLTAKPPDACFRRWTLDCDRFTAKHERAVARRLSKCFAGQRTKFFRESLGINDVDLANDIGLRLALCMKDLDQAVA